MVLQLPIFTFLMPSYLLPRIVGGTNREIGDRVVTQFSRYAIGL
jgi:hypothetical protein